MEQISCASIIGSIMYAQVCTWLNIAYAVGMFS